MKQVLSKFGAYTVHLAALVADRSLKGTIYIKWTDAKYLIVALFVDLLTPCMNFSKCMQSNKVDTLGAALNVILKMLKEI